MNTDHTADLGKLDPAFTGFKLHNGCIVLPVCGELVLKLRQAGDTVLGSNCASGRNADLRLLIVTCRLFRSARIGE